MKSMKMMFGIGLLALGVTTAASGYSVTLRDPLWIGQTELKPGEYKVEMDGDKAVFTARKISIQVPAKLETNEKKFATTAVSTNGKQIVEIDFGGSTAKMLFSK